MGLILIYELFICDQRKNMSMTDSIVGMGWGRDATPNSNLPTLSLEITLNLFWKPPPFSTLLHIFFLDS